MQEKGVLKNIKRVGGTSAGAINATLFALGYSIADQRRILKKLDFNNFMDDNWGLVRDTQRLIEEVRLVQGGLLSITGYPG
jgi:NTE family protein